MPERPAAGLRPRLLAFALDYVLIAAYAALLAAVMLFLSATSPRGLMEVVVATPNRRDTLAFVTLVLPVIVYFAVLEASGWQGTWGKRKLALRVTTLNGGRLPAGRALVRSILKFLPWQLAHTSLFHIPGWPLAPTSPPGWIVSGFAMVWVLITAYLATLAFDRSHRTPYDRLAGSRVVAETRQEGVVTPAMSGPSGAPGRTSTGSAELPVQHAVRDEVAVLVPGQAERRSH